jgi:hypothetical protein
MNGHLRPLLSLDYPGTISWYYFMAGVEIVQTELCDRNKKGRSVKTTHIQESFFVSMHKKMPILS